MPTSSPSAAITAGPLSRVGRRPARRPARSPTQLRAAARPASGHRVRHSARRRRTRSWSTRLRTRWPCVDSSRSACSVAVSPMAGTVYGGVSGRLLTWMADAELRMRERGEPLAVDRDRLGARLHRPSTSSGEVLVAHLPGDVAAGASSTVIRTPWPRHRAEAGADLEPAATAAVGGARPPVTAASCCDRRLDVACAAAARSRACRATTSSARAGRSARSGRPGLRSLTSASREVCTRRRGDQQPEDGQRPRPRPVRAARDAAGRRPARARGAAATWDVVLVDGLLGDQRQQRAS